jgi:hypothetical protein
MLGVQAGLDALGKLNLVNRAQQGRFANAVQVHAYEICGWALGIQIVLGAGCCGTCHGGLLLGLAVMSSNAAGGSQVPGGQSIHAV